MRTLRIGTRRSALALRQAEEVARLLAADGLAAEIVAMSTAGDEGATAAPDSPAGRKGLWTDAIAEALRAGELDLAVHSAKDLPAEDDDLVIGAVPPREDPRDVLLWRDGGDGALAPGAVLGTASLRRAAQLRAVEPGLEVRELRGNVETRLRKLDEGEADLTVLAAAGLARMGIAPPNARVLGIDEMLPAPGQGALAVQIRASARDVHAILTAFDDRASHAALDAERELARELGGGCALPLGALAVLRGDAIRLAAVVASPDGATVVRAATEAATPRRAALVVAAALRDQGAEEVLAAVRPGEGDPAPEPDGPDLAGSAP